MTAKPKVDRLVQPAGIERVDLGPPHPFDTDQSGFLEHVEMLGYRLARDRHPILRGRKGANLEQRLPRTLAQAIHDLATRGVAKSLEDAVELIVIHVVQYAIKSLHIKVRDNRPAAAIIDVTAGDGRKLGADSA